MLKQLEKDKNRFLIKLLAIVVFLTNISQIPYLVESNSTGYLSNMGWIIVVIVLLLKNRIIFKEIDIKVISLSLLFLFGIMISELLTSNGQLKSNLINSFYLAVFILLIGSFVSNSFNTETIKIIINYYAFSILIVSLNLFFKVFSEGFNWFSIGYAYGSKNSISQMILIAIILVYYCYSFNNKLLNIARILVLIFWLLLLLALKSRATIVFLLIMPLYIIIEPKINIKIKTVVITLIISIVIIFIINPLFYEIVVDGVLLGGRRGGTIDEISSNRLTHITVNFPMWFKGNELLGTGTYFVESLPFNAILKHGILFGWIPIFMAVWPSLWALRNLDKNNSLHLAFTLISLSFLVNSLFEGLAPFGPGAKTYFLWLMFGILYSNRELLTTKYKKIT